MLLHFVHFLRLCIQHVQSGLLLIPNSSEFSSRRVKVSKEKKNPTIAAHCPASCGFIIRFSLWGGGGGGGGHLISSS